MFNFSKYLVNPESFSNKKGEIALPSLLSGNSKLDKGESIVFGLALMPSDGINAYLKPTYSTPTVCPLADQVGCASACLIESGHYAVGLSSARKAAIKRSILFHFDNELFTNILLAELVKISAIYKSAYIRLDVFSDNKKYNNKIIKRCSALGLDNLVFYDYSKIPTIEKLDSSYSENIAYSISNVSPLSAIGKFAYYSIVVPMGEKTNVRQALSKRFDNLRVVDGDKLDYFPIYNGTLEKPVILVLGAKGIKNTTKNSTISIYSQYDRFLELLNKGVIHAKII